MKFEDYYEKKYTPEEMRAMNAPTDIGRITARRLALGKSPEPNESEAILNRPLLSRILDSKPSQFLSLLIIDVPMYIMFSPLLLIQGICWLFKREE